MAVKRSWLITGAAMALAAVLTLPPRPAPEEAGLFSMLTWFWRGLPVYGRTRHRWELESARGTLRQRVEQLARNDSILGLVRAGRGVRSADGAITVLYERPLSADSARRWLAALEAEATLYPRGTGRGGRAVVALYSDPSRLRARQGAVPRLWGRRQWYAGPPEAPVCIVEANLAAPPRGWWSRTSLMARDSAGPSARVLNVCALVVRLGPPGRSVGDWVNAAVPDQNWRGSALSGLVASARAGLEPLPWAGASFPERACLRGSAFHCEWLTGLHRMPNETRRWLGGDPLTWSYRQRFLVHLLTKRGPERFAALWSSPAPIGEALHQAYGRPAGELVADWMKASNPPAAAGPGVGSRAVLASAGWALALLAGALLASLRWRSD
jgi:hypothetical protein